MDKELQIEYNKLYATFKEMEGSKLILTEKSVSKLLKVIAQNDGLYNLIAETVLGFNFDKELDLLMKNDEFKLPSSNDKIIPLVFCILNEIDNGKISAISFITKTFTDSTEEGYKKFCKQLVEPFVFAIKDVIGADDAPEQFLNQDEINETKKVEAFFTNDLISRMNYVLNEVTNKIGELKRVNLEYKNNASTIAFSAGLCLAEGQYLGVFGLFLGLKIALVKLKKFKNEIKEIDLLLSALYEIS